MAGPFHAIKFEMIEFGKGWERIMLVTGYANIRYTVTQRGAKLAVVTEDADGDQKTYRYTIPNGEEVMVVDQVVHIPAGCQKVEVGNTIKCSS